MPRTVLLVVPQAGGNVQPCLRIGAALAGRGHAVTVLGHPQLAGAAGEAGLAFEPMRHARRWQPVHDRPGPLPMLDWLTLATDRGVAADLTEVGRRLRPDLVVVDCMVPGALPAARGLGVPTALVLHTVQRYWADLWSPRSAMGVWLRLHRLLPSMHRPDLAVVTTLPEIDPGPPVLVPSVQVGPVLGPLGEPSSRSAGLPVLVSFSTISYPGQQAVVQRVLDAVEAAGRTAVVTNAAALSGLRVPAGVRVEPFVPHQQVLPGVGALVGHGGHGTAMTALAHHVPVLTVPLSSLADHALVGAAIERAGAGRTVSKRAPVEQVAAALTATLGLAVEPVRRLGDAVRAARAADAAADALEALG